MSTDIQPVKLGTQPVIGSREWYGQTTAQEFLYTVDFLRQERNRIFSANFLTENYVSHMDTYTNRHATSWQYLDSVIDILEGFGKSEHFSNAMAPFILFKRLHNTLRWASQFQGYKAGLIQSTLFVFRSKMLQLSAFNFHKNWQKEATQGSLFGKMEPKAIIVGSQTLMLETNSYGKTAEISKLFNDILALHGVASHSATISEEKHFLDQVLSSYLPEIVEASKAVSAASPEVKEKAEMNFLQQLTLIENKLQEMVDTASARTLRDVEVQTAFLTERFANKPVTQALALNEGVLN